MLGPSCIWTQFAVTQDKQTTLFYYILCCHLAPMPTQQFPLWRSLVALWRSSFISSDWQWSLFSHTSIFRRTTIPLKPMNNKSVMRFKLSLCKSSFSQKLEKLKMKLSFQLKFKQCHCLHLACFSSTSISCDVFPKMFTIIQEV